MKDILMIITIIINRIKNRVFIFASQRPEVFFILMLMVIAGGGAAFFLPALLDYNLDITIDQFPNISYTFITASIFPFIIWILRMNRHEIETFSILEYIFRDSFKYIKVTLNYFVPATLSFVFMYLILSIFQNIHIVSSILFWHIIGLVIILASYSITLIINNKLVEINILNNNPLFFKVMVIGLVLLIMVLPIHTFIGELWLSEALPFPVLILLWLTFLGLYVYIYSQKIRYGILETGVFVKKQRFSEKDNLYGFLLLIDIKRYYIFSFLSLLFMLILSLISNQYFVMIDLLVIIIIIGNIGLVFGKVEKVARGLYSLRASNFIFAIWLQNLYSVLAFASIFLFYILLSFASPYNIQFLISNTDIFTNMVVVYFCIYLSIVAAYTFGEFFGPILQSLSSGIILIISYRIMPDLLTRVISIQNIYIEGIVWLFLLGMLLVIKWITIREYKNSESI